MFNQIKIFFKRSSTILYNMNMSSFNQHSNYKHQQFLPTFPISNKAKVSLFEYLFLFNSVWEIFKDRTDESKNMIKLMNFPAGEQVTLSVVMYESYLSQIFLNVDVIIFYIFANDMHKTKACCCLDLHFPHNCWCCVF